MYIYVIYIYIIFSLFYFNLVIIFIWNIILILFAFSHMEHFYNLIEMSICFPLLFITFNLNLWTLFQRPASPFSSHFMIWFHALSSFSAQFCRLPKDLQTHFSHVLLFSVILNGATHPVISTSLLHFSLNFYVFPWSYFLMHEELIPAFLLYQCLLWMADFAIFLLLLKSFQNFLYNIFMYTAQVVLHLVWLFVQCQWYKLVLGKRHRHYFSNIDSAFYSFISRIPAMANFLLYLVLSVHDILGILNAVWLVSFVLSHQLNITYSNLYYWYCIFIKLSSLFIFYKFHILW